MRPGSCGMTKRQSPCRGCKNELEDKRKHPECVACDLPIIYEKSLGCHGESVPAEVVKMSENPEEKVCKDPKCIHEGKSQPVDTNFQIHGPSGQRMGVCKDCMGRKMSTGKKNKTSAAKTEKQKPDKKDRIEELGNRKEKQAVSELPSLPASSPPSISIDFSGYEELLDLIRLVAEAEERTVEKQLFYWIKKMDIEKLRGYLDDGPSVLS